MGPCYLELAAEMRLEHNADAYRQEAALGDASGGDAESADEEHEHADQ